MAHSCHCVNQCWQCGSCCMFTCAHRGGGTLAPLVPSIPQIPTRHGWMCPRCGRVYSPDSDQCAPCNARSG